MDDSSSLGRGDIQRRAVQGVSWTLIHTVVSIPVAFIGTLIVARVLGVVDFGRLAYLTTVMEIVTAVLTAGLGTALVQFGARRHATSRYGEVEHLLAISQGFRLVFFAPLLVIAMLFVVDVPTPLMVIAIFFGVLLPGYLGEASSGLAIENKTASDAKIAMVSNLVIQVAVVVTVLIMRQADAVWATRIAAAGLATGLALIPLRASYRRAVLRPKLPRRFPTGFWRFAIPTGLSLLIAQLVISRTEVVLLEALSTPAAVGIYALAFGVAGNVFAPARAFTGPLIPALSSLSETTDRATMGRAFARTLRASSTVSSLLIAVGIPAIAVLVPVLYGSDFSGAALPVVVLGCAGGIAVASTPVMAFTLARQSARHLLVVNIVALIVNVSAAFLLIPPLGIWGAVLANIAGVLTRMVVLLAGEARALDIRKSAVLRMLTPVACGIAAAWVSWGVAVLTPLPAIADACVCGAVGLVAVLALLRLCRTGIDAHDAHVIVDGVPRLLAPIARPFIALVTRR